MPDEVDIRFRVDDKELDSAARKVQTFGPTADKSFKEASQGGGISGLMSKVTNLGFAVFGLQQTVGAVGGLFQGMFGGNIQFEQFESQFATLFKGDVDKAKARMKELATFAKDTPFELPEVVNASKILETFGGATLSTGAGLRLLGDVASGTGTPIGELAVHWGRLYDGLQNGRPVGEAMMRLQEIGAISGDTRNKIEEMQKAGVSGDVVWATLTDSMDKYAGGMERQSKTMGGAISNIQDGIGALKRNLMQGIFDAAKPAVMGLATWLGSEGVQGAALKAGEAIGAVLGGAVKILIELISASIGPISSFVGWLGPKLVGPAKDALQFTKDLARGFEDLWQYISFTWKEGDYLNDWLTHLPAPMRPAVEMLGEMTVKLHELINTIMEMDAGDWAGIWNSITEAVQPALDVLRPLAEDVLMELNKQFGEVGETLKSAFANLKGLEVDWKALGTAIGTVATIISAAFLVQARLFIDMVGTAFKVNIRLAVIAIETFVTVLEGLVEAAKGVVNFFVGVFTGDWDRAWKGIQQIFDGVITAIKGSIGGFIESAKTVISGGLEFIKDQFRIIWEGIDQLTGGKLTDIKDAVGGFLTDVASKISGAAGNIKDKAMAVFNGMKDGIWAVLTGIVDNDIVRFMKDVGLGIYNKIAEVKANAVLLGKDIMQGIFDGIGRIAGIGEDIVKGIWDGISSMGGWLWGKVRNFAKNNIVDAVKDILSIFSPSKVMANEVGVPVVQGIIAGVESQTGALNSSIDRIVGSALGVATAGVQRIQSVMGAAVPAADGIFRNPALAATFPVFPNQTMPSAPAVWTPAPTDYYHNQSQAPWWQGSMQGGARVNVNIGNVQVNDPVDLETAVNGIGYGIIQNLQSAGVS